MLSLPKKSSNSTIHTGTFRPSRDIAHIVIKYPNSIDENGFLTPSALYVKRWFAGCYVQKTNDRAIVIIGLLVDSSIKITRTIRFTDPQGNPQHAFTFNNQCDYEIRLNDTGCGDKNTVIDPCRIPLFQLSNSVSPMRL